MLHWLGGPSAVAGRERGCAGRSRRWRTPTAREASYRGVGRQSLELNAKPGASVRKHTRKQAIIHAGSSPFIARRKRVIRDLLLLCAASCKQSLQVRALPKAALQALHKPEQQRCKTRRRRKKRKKMDSFLTSLQTLQKKPKATTTNALDVFGFERAEPKTTKTIAPDDYAPPKTSAPIFGAWPILPGAPTIPTCARAPPKRPREGATGRDHYGRGGGGRGRGGGGKGRGRGSKGGKGKGRGKGGAAAAGGRGRGGRGKGKGRRRDGPRAGAAVCAALDLEATDAPRVEELVKRPTPHKEKVQEHLAVARAEAIR